MNINYNIKKICEELRKKILEIPEVEEINKSEFLIYKYKNEKEFCNIKIKKDYLEIDFIADKTVEDPIKFSWKIKPTRDSEFNRRMQIKNIAQIDTAFGLIYQAYNAVR